MQKFLGLLTEKIINGGEITFEEASRIIGIKRQKNIVFLLGFANSIRDEFFGSTIDLCAIINAKSGSCSENCIFCSQSSHYNTDIKRYPLMKREDIVKKAEDAGRLGINRFSIVVSGRDVKDPGEWAAICSTIADISSIDRLEACASLGTLTREAARELKTAGLGRYHHNLETAESFFPKICTTHAYKARTDTVRVAHEEGLSICCGGIFGIGETPGQRLEFAFTLKDLDVDSIPLNFLNPILNTPLQDALPLQPMEILKTIAVFRFINPEKSIRICGGRQKNLRDMQPLIFLAGANGVMTGDYLTTAGGNTGDDLHMIEDLMLAAEK